MAESWFNADRNAWAVGVTHDGMTIEAVAYYQSRQEAELETARLSRTIF